MPLSINVGLSRKASKDYQSTGVSINIVAELDQNLLAKPDELQQQIDGLYGQARGAIDRQAASPQPAENDRGDRDRQPRRYNRSEHGRNNGNGHHANGNAGSNGGTMTASQRRAILAIADRAHANVDKECREIIGNQFDALSVREASELIDHLKSLVPADDRRR